MAEVKDILLKVIKLDNVLIYIGDITLLTNDADFYDKCYQSISDLRKKKCSGFKRLLDRARCIGAGIMLDIALAEYGLREKDTICLLGENGKPFLKDFPDINFNLSHSGYRVMCALSQFPVGCDVERINPESRNIIRIAERFFSKNEKTKLFKFFPEYRSNLKKEILRKEEPERIQEIAEMFFKIWTLKESYVKCTGEGMQCPFDGFSVVDDSGNFAIQTDPEISLISFDEGGYCFGAALNRYSLG